jgi:hypothetical protein
MFRTDKIIHENTQMLEQLKDVITEFCKTPSGIVNTASLFIVPAIKFLFINPVNSENKQTKL